MSENSQLQSDEPVPSTSSACLNMKSKTATESKLAMFNNTCVPTMCEISNDPDYMLVHVSVWNNIIKNFKCNGCGTQALHANVGDIMGLASTVTINCSACGECCAKANSSPRVSDTDSTRAPFDVNKRMVDGFVSMGKGLAGMKKFCTSMGMNCMSSSTYNSHLYEIVKDNKSISKKVVDMARKRVHLVHIEENPHLDGTWHKRGHTSNYGVGFVIDVLTGLVIDYELLSRYCAKCCINKSNKDSESFKVWQQNHKASGECEQNFTGSANAMEMMAAEIMWKRSVEACKMRYTTLLSDGDAKTHKHLFDLAVYGDNIEIKKEECLNHIAKRLGTGLRNVVKEWRSKGLTLGGKKIGSLKEETIVKLQNYYRKTIKDNVDNIQHMKSAIYATLYHCTSTDKEPKHFKCPGGETSWCFFNRAIANGEPIPKHQDNMKTVISSTVLQKIMCVYQRLATNELLERCSSGKTQNPNESLHSVVWAKCPKEVFISRKKLDIAITQGISEFNMGCEASQKVKDLISGVKTSPAALKLSFARDRQRIMDSIRKGSKSYQTRRKGLKFSKSKAEQTLKEAEGPTYGAGQF